MREKAVKVFDRIIYWSIVFFPFSMAIAPAFTGIAVGFLFFSYFTRKIINRERFSFKTSVDNAYLLWVIIAAVSIFKSIDLHASLRGMLKFAQYGIAFLIIAEQVKDRLHLKRVLIACLLGGALASFDAVWQMIFGVDFIRGHVPHLKIGLTRATAGFPNPNVLGVYLSPLAAFGFPFALYYLKGFKRLKLFGVLALICAGLFFTFSRPAALALFVSILILGIVKKDKPLLITMLVLLLIAPFIAPRNIKEWARHVRYNPIIFMCNYDRMSIYGDALNMIRHNPVIGVGISTFDNNYKYYKVREVTEEEKTGESLYAHDNILQIAGETGLLGLAAFLYFLFRLFSNCVKVYRKQTDKFLKTYALAATAGLIAFQINGLTETNLFYARVAWVFWIMVGLSLSLNKFIEKG